MDDVKDIKLLIEPDRSILPTEIHKSKEYKFMISQSENDDLINTLQEKIKNIMPEISGMCGVTVDRGNGRVDDFFISVNEGRLMQW